jgi:hypothetical protein
VLTLNACVILRQNGTRRSISMEVEVLRKDDTIIG